MCFATYIIWRRICNKLANGEIQVAGDQWSIFLYANYTYDPEDPWNGLLRSGLLVSVSSGGIWFIYLLLTLPTQAYKHIFTSPSSVDQEPKATRSGNARIHGMRSVTKASLAYVATQVSVGECCFLMCWHVLQARFALTSAQVFSCTDLITDSERFYTSILELLDDADEKGEVDQLMAWWNRWVTFRNDWLLLMKKAVRYFHCIRTLNAFRPRIVLLRGSVRSARNIMRGTLMQLMVLTDCHHWRHT